MGWRDILPKNFVPREIASLVTTRWAVDRTSHNPSRAAFVANLGDSREVSIVVRRAESRPFSKPELKVELYDFHVAQLDEELYRGRDPAAASDAFMSIVWLFGRAPSYATTPRGVVSGAAGLASIGINDQDTFVKTDAAEADGFTHSFCWLGNRWFVAGPCAFIEDVFGRPDHQWSVQPPASILRMY